MDITERPATMKLPEAWRTGDAWADVIYRGEGPGNITHSSEDHQQHPESATEPLAGQARPVTQQARPLTSPA